MKHSQQQTFKLFKTLLLLFVFLNLFACSELKTTLTSPSLPTTSSEISICNTSTPYSPGVPVSGTAVFKKRGLNITVSNITLGGVNATSLPIKYAEIRVLNSSGQVIQCGATNASGELKALDGYSNLLLPNESGSYTIEVLSRSHQVFTSTFKTVSPTLDVSIKEDIYSNNVYKISTTLSSSGVSGTTNSSVSLIAQADENISSKIEGGAFNIYNNWITTFEYISSGTVTATADVSCLNQPLDIYWKAGFNPYLYIYPDGDPTNTLSFYLRGDNELYINGGVSGNVTSTDTDHFDDAVILHEIGHHIEAVCGTMDSPGGKHYAQKRIDPRLAWSEGWGNFFGAHIIKNNIAKINPDAIPNLTSGDWLYYNDTTGYGGSGSSLILMRLNQSGSTASFDTVNPASYPGESHTREASISRGLFKGTNSCSGTTCTNSISFENYWKALGKTSDGMGTAATPFRSSAMFIDKIKNLYAGNLPAAFNTMITSDEALHTVGDSALNVVSGSTTYNAWPGYAIGLSSGTCNETMLQPRNLANTNFSESDQRYTNHFYTIDTASLSSVKMIVSSNNVECPLDIDLILFKENYRYNEDCTSYYSNNTCATFAKTTSSYVATYNRSSFTVSGTTRTKTLSFAGVPSGKYLLNIRYFSTTPASTSVGTKCVYTLQNQSGGLLCPNTSY